MKNNPLSVKIPRLAGMTSTKPTPKSGNNKNHNNNNTSLGDDDVFDILPEKKQGIGVKLGLDTKDYLGTLDSNPFFMDTKTPTTNLSSSNNDL